MTETEPEAQAPVPGTETRGGERPDWDHVVPGEALPELPEPEARMPGRRQAADWCGTPECGGD